MIMILKKQQANKNQEFPNSFEVYQAIWLIH